MSIKSKLFLTAAIILVASGSMVKAYAQDAVIIAPEIKITAREYHELGMREWYQANFEKAEELLVESADLVPQSEYLLDAAGIFLAQRKIEPAFDYIDRAKSASLDEFGAHSLPYADSLAIEAEIAAIDGDIERTKEASMIADGIYLEVIKTPPADVPFARDQALFSYGQNSHNYVAALIDNEQYELASIKLRDLRTFFERFKAPLPNENQHALLTGQALAGLGRFDDALAALSSIDVEALLVSHELAANQVGLRIVQAKTDIFEAAGQEAQSLAYLADMRDQLITDYEFEEGDPRQDVLDRINQALADLPSTDLPTDE